MGNDCYGVRTQVNFLFHRKHILSGRLHSQRSKLFYLFLTDFLVQQAVGRDERSARKAHIAPLSTKTPDIDRLRDASRAA